MRPLLSFLFFRLQSDGSYRAISYNDPARAPYMQIPVEDVSKVYRAIKRFNTEMYSDNNIIEIKLNDGMSYKM